MAENIVNTSDARFDADVLGNKSGPVLVDFWAAWCGPCRALAPKLEEVANETNGRAQVVKLDVDANPDSAAKFGVRGIPTMIVFKNGQEIGRLVGNQPKEAILDLLMKN